MRLPRPIRLRIALASVVGLLLAQWAVSAYACAWPGPLGAEVVATADCDGGHGGQPDPLCYRHCIGDQGASPVYAAALAAMPADARAAAVIGHAPEAESIPNGPFPAARGQPPPLFILLQRFLI